MLARTLSLFVDSSFPANFLLKLTVPVVDVAKLVVLGTRSRPPPVTLAVLMLITVCRRLLILLAGRATVVEPGRSSLESEDGGNALVANGLSPPDVPGLPTFEGRYTTLDVAEDMAEA